MVKKARASGGKSGGKSRWDWLFSALLLILIGLAIWAIIQNDVWSQVTSWYDGAYSNVKGAVGWGIIFLILALLTLIFLIWRGKLMSLQELESMARHHCLVFAAWGILAFSSQADPNPGGTFGSWHHRGNDFLRVR